MMNIYVFHHAHCIDGITAAAAFELLTKDEFNLIYHPVNYDNTYHNVVLNQPYKDGDTIVFVDFAPTIEWLEQVRNVITGDSDRVDHELDVKLHILDHHATSETMLKQVPILKDELFYFNNDISGAKIAFAYVETLQKYGEVTLETLEESIQATSVFEYTNPDPACMDNDKFHIIKEHVSDRDTWQFKLEKTNLYYHYLRFMASETNWDVPEYYRKIMLSTIPEIECIGDVLTKKYESDCQTLARRAVILPSVEQPQFALVNVSPDTASRVGEILYGEQNVPVVIMYYDDLAKGFRQYQLRSKAPWDVGKIAALLGGGGHAQAAGVRIKHTSSAKDIVFNDVAVAALFEAALAETFK